VAEDHPFTVNIELHVAQRVRRYQWSICESGKPRDRSTKSFATMREAPADADEVMEKLIRAWRTGKMTKSGP
jgi:hypothetical protein